MNYTRINAEIYQLICSQLGQLPAGKADNLSAMLTQVACRCYSEGRQAGEEELLESKLTAEFDLDIIIEAEDERDTRNTLDLRPSRL